MEGFLFKKGRGDSSFGRRNWKKRWFELEENELRYYDDLDAQGLPMGLRDAIDISGCSALPVTHHDKKFTFVLKFPPEANCADILMQAPDMKAMNIWIKELSAAAKGENLRNEINYAELYELLGLSEEDDPSVADISRAYRRAALKAHPDKGGNMAQFKEIQNAYQQVIARIEEEENEKLFDTLEYEVILIKGGGDAGLGLLVSEDAQKRIITIKDVLPAVQIKSLNPPNVGNLKAGDVLIAIRNENVIHMPLTRVAQKLNEARVPVNTSVKLTFRRKFRKDGSDNYGAVPTEEKNEDSEEGYSEKQYDNQDDPIATSSSKLNTPTTEPLHSNAEYSSTPSPVPHRASHNNPSQPFIPVPPSQNSQQQQRFEESSDLPPSNYSSHIDPVTYVAVMAENDELKVDLSSKEKELEKSKIENEKLKEELLKYQQGYSETDHQKKRLEVHLQHAYLLSKMSREQMANSMSQILLVSKKILANTPFETNSEILHILGKENLNEEQIKDDGVKMAQRSAIIATMNMESLGHSVQRWNQEGDGAVKKLERLEEKLKGVDLKTLARIPSPTRSSSSSQPNIFSPPPRGSLGNTRGNSSTNYQFQPHVSSNNSIGSQTSHQSAPVPRPVIPQLGMSIHHQQQHPSAINAGMTSPSYMNPTRASGPRGAPLQRSMTSRY